MKFFGIIIVGLVFFAFTFGVGLLTAFLVIQQVRTVGLTGPILHLAIFSFFLNTINLAVVCSPIREITPIG